MKKYVFGILILVMFLIYGCATQTVTDVTTETQSEIGDEEGATAKVTVEEAPTPLPPNVGKPPPAPVSPIPTETAAASEESVADSTVKEFTMTAKKFEFNPSTITVNKGDTVKLAITSLDIAHGFAINEFNVRETLPVGETVIVEFVADKSGTFSFYCSIPCGFGHSGMKGTLIVK